MTAQKLILQQYYTRDREGIFRTNEGLDTVAKSPSLDNNFIKKTLHPYCLYNTPQALRERDETDLTKYPESVWMFYADSGELVLGRSVFAGSDFTGQRNTFFTHNYVIPKELIEPFILNPSSIFRINSFQSKYDIKNGKNLAELSEIGFNRSSENSNQDEFLRALGINERIYKQLIQALMIAVAGNKKVYIALNTDISLSSLYAKNLLEILFEGLPYAVRRSLGFITYNNEPQGKKFIDVMFVEKGSIRQGDRSIEKDYVFDFSQQFFLNTDIVDNDPRFINFVWENRHNPEKLKDFYKFAEQALQGTTSEKCLSLATYNELLVLYKIEEGDSELYKLHKDAVINGIIGYLTVNKSAERTQLDQLFHKLVRIDIDQSNNGIIPSIGYMNSLFHYYIMASEQAKSMIVNILIVFLFNGKNKEDYLTQVFQSMQKHPLLFTAVFKQIQDNRNYSTIINEYLVKRFLVINDAAKLKDELTFWKKYHSEILEYPIFKDHCSEKIKQLVGKENKAKLAIASKLNTLLKSFYSSVPGSDFEDFYGEQKIYLAKEALKHLSYEEIKLEELNYLSFIHEESFSKAAKSLEPELQRKRNALRAVTNLLATVNPEIIEINNIMDIVDSRGKQEVKDHLKILLKERINSGHYGLIVYAFEQAEEEHDVKRYYELLNFVDKASGRSGEVYDFMVWSVTQKSFQTYNKRITPPYQNAIRIFFSNHPEAMSDKKIWERLKNTDNSSFKKMLAEIKLDNSNMLIRLFYKNWKKLVIILLTAIITVLIILIALKMLKKSDDEPNVIIDLTPTITDAVYASTASLTPVPTETIVPSSSPQGTSTSTAIPKNTNSGG